MWEGKDLAEREMKVVRDGCDWADDTGDLAPGWR